MAMVEGVSDLSLAVLNEATLAWVEMEYHRKPHRETGQPPLTRFADGPSVSRESPSSDRLRLAFTRQVTRTQRKSDGTFTLDGVRFEVPSRYRHLDHLAAHAKSRLDLTPPQEEDWRRLEEALRAIEGRFEEVCAEAAKAGPAPTAPAQLARFEAVMSAGLEAIHRVRPAFDAFYDGLSTAQRQTLDGLLNWRRHG